MRIGGEERWIASEDAGLYRDALGAVPPGGLPDAFLEEVEEPLARLARRYARTHGPFTTARRCRTATASTSGRCCASSSAAASWSAASCAPAAASASGATPTCCAACAARRWRRCARRSSRPSSGRWRASCRPGRAWTPRRPAAPAWTACASCSCRSRAWRSRPRSGSATCCPRRVGQLLAGLDRPALRGRRARLGRRRRRSAAARAAWRSTSARTRAGSARRRCKGEPPAEPLHDAIRERLGARRRLLDRPARRPRPRPSRSSCRRRSGTSSGPAR